MSCRVAHTREFHISINNEANVFRVELSMLHPEMRYPVIEWASPRMVMLTYDTGRERWYMGVGLLNRTGRKWTVDVIEEKYYLTVELEEWEDG